MIRRTDADTAIFEVASGKGVYMRSLARDLAQACGTVGHIAALRRKLRGLGAVVQDPAATAAEKVNATALKKRLEQRLRQAGAPAGDWTDHAFRLGRWAKEMRKSEPAAPTAIR